MRHWRTPFVPEQGPEEGSGGALQARWWEGLAEREYSSPGLRINGEGLQGGKVHGMASPSRPVVHIEYMGATIQ